MNMKTKARKALVSMIVCVSLSSCAASGTDMRLREDRRVRMDGWSIAAGSFPEDVTYEVSSTPEPMIPDSPSAHAIVSTDVVEGEIISVVYFLRGGEIWTMLDVQTRTVLKGDLLDGELISVFLYGGTAPAREWALANPGGIKPVSGYVSADPVFSYDSEPGSRGVFFLYKAVNLSGLDPAGYFASSVMSHQTGGVPDDAYVYSRAGNNAVNTLKEIEGLCP